MTAEVDSAFKTAGVRKSTKGTTAVKQALSSMAVPANPQLGGGSSATSSGSGDPGQLILPPHNFVRPDTSGTANISDSFFKLNSPGASKAKRKRCLREMQKETS